MTAGQLKAILERVPSHTQILTGEVESEITDTFLTVTGAFRLIDYENNSDALILIEKTDV